MFKPKLEYKHNNFSIIQKFFVLNIIFGNFSTLKKEQTLKHYLQWIQKGPIVFTRSARVLAQLFVLLSTKQGIL